MKILSNLMSQFEYIAKIRVELSDKFFKVLSNLLPFSEFVTKGMFEHFVSFVELVSKRQYSTFLYSNFSFLVLKCTFEEKKRLFCKQNVFAQICESLLEGKKAFR